MPRVPITTVSMEPGCSCCTSGTVSRKMIMDAVTPDIRAEFTQLVNDLARLTDRTERARVFNSSLEELTDEARDLLQLSSYKERQHIVHVRRTLAAIAEQPQDRLPHDFSKDSLYFFTTSSKFDFGVKSEAMEVLFKIETERHYQLERHHEQYERIHNVGFNEDDIREMAIDRMSRGIQNNGYVDLENMANYVPKFPLGDNDFKQQLFNSFVLQYKDLTEEKFLDREVLYPREN